MDEHIFSPSRCFSRLLSLHNRLKYRTRPRYRTLPHLPSHSSEDALEFVDTNFNIIVYTLTWIACIAGLLWSMLMSYVIVARPTEPTPTVLILAKYVRWTAAGGIALLLVPFLRCETRRGHISARWRTSTNMRDDISPTLCLCRVSLSAQQRRIHNSRAVTSRKCAAANSSSSSTASTGGRNSRGERTRTRFTTRSSTSQHHTCSRRACDGHSIMTIVTTRKSSTIGNAAIDAPTALPRCPTPSAPSQHSVNSYRVHGIWQRIAFWSSAKPAGLDRSRSIA